jgi:hypothetical protein
MRVNDALDAGEIADGWALTCQTEPATPDVTVTYDDWPLPGIRASDMLAR